MNYLAHLLLSANTPEIAIGGLLGDFVKGGRDRDYAPAVRAGILLHRDIDRYTDAHAAHRASRALISPERRRFAGILVDVFYDHFLVRHWASFSSAPLAEFTATIYAILLRHRSGFPERLQHILPAMARDDWLGSYGDPAAVAAALDGIRRRFGRYRRAAALAGAVAELEARYAEHERQFLDFFPELLGYVEARGLSPANDWLKPRAARRC
ncbi:MAG TPA: ACP phosphodiesterase [Acidiferrobacterales bacterium]|jgi:acyl carrier protein phosphodiesterase